MKRHGALPWEIMRLAKDLFGTGYLRRLLNVTSDKHVYRYCRNPDIATADPAIPCFIARSRTLAVDLNEAGEREAAKSIAVCIADAIGFEVVDHSEVKPDKDTIHEEMCDDFHAVCALHKGIHDNLHPTELEPLFSAAMDEIRQTKTKHSQDYFKKNKKRAA